MNFDNRTIMVFDVESVGLHGEGFAVGWVVIKNKKEFDARLYHCPPDDATGDEVGRLWIKNHIPKLPDYALLSSPRAVREMFWKEWISWRGEDGVLLFADCPWPVESNFLNACIADNQSQRYWQGPYPLIDIASVRLAKGFDPLAVDPRQPDEYPEHNPLSDAIQSARLLMEAFDQIIN